jgi:hypothetical protein
MVLPLIAPSDAARSRSRGTLIKTPSVRPRKTDLRWKVSTPRSSNASTTRRPISAASPSLMCASPKIARLRPSGARRTRTA